jgi:hypothetical protein
MSEYIHIEKQLIELREKRRTVGIMIGNMARTPKSDYHYSVAKMDDWIRQAEKLDDQINELEGKRIELEPDYMMQQQKRK